MTAKAVKKVLAVGPDKSLRLVCPECGEASLLLRKVDVPINRRTPGVAVTLVCGACGRHVNLALRTRQPGGETAYTTMSLMAITY